jgi:hypothetical protein
MSRAELAVAVAVLVAIAVVSVLCMPPLGGV